MRDLPLLPLLLTAVEATATIAFALSGLLEAARKRLDAVGVCVVAGLAAFGGGTLRDVLLDRRPFFWVEHAVWLWALLALCVGAMAWLRARHFAPTEKAMQWPDALGLGLFSAGGTQLALAQGLPPIVAVLMGVVTATFGGVLRDIVCNEIPPSATTALMRCAPSSAAGCSSAATRWACPTAPRCWPLPAPPPACAGWRCSPTTGCHSGRRTARRATGSGEAMRRARMPASRAVHPNRPCRNQPASSTAAGRRLR